MKVIKRLLLLQFAVLFLFSHNAYAEKNSGIEAVKGTVESVLEVMKDDSLAPPEKKEERRERVKVLVSERFDFREMSKRALGRHWKKLSAVEQDEFVKLFSGLLQNTYIGKIEAYTDEKVTFDKEIIRKKGRYSVVQTSIYSKDIIIPIDYRLIKKRDEWRVYDVLVEGVSIISNYRSQYNKILSRESFADLIQKMKEKLEKV